MFSVRAGRMLASMSEFDPRADTPLVDWSELGVSELLPTGTVTLLLADVEGSTRLWETQPDEMTVAMARMNRTVSETIATHDGVRPVEQGEGDSFVAAFARASDAVACAIELQRAPLAPIRLRIGIHTGEIQLRDEGNYAGPTINRTARLRDLGHGGQTLISSATEAMVLDTLPSDAWLSDLGTHPLRDLPRPERTIQLCHPDVVNEFPPLRVSKTIGFSRLPVQLTSFVGRDQQLAQVRELLSHNRLITLTGAGGVGKTRLAIHIADQLFGDFGDGVWYVDLAPITDPDLVPTTAARAFGLPDQPGRSTMDTLSRFVADRQMLMVLDNCEHLLDACTDLVATLLATGPGLTLMTTSREPIGVAGEISWRVPSLSLADEAIELFSDRARRVRPAFAVDDDSARVIGEICARLDGVPLAIELAAARVRALSPTEILDSLHDRFRLLTGGARTAVRRQQTLRASVDWSHALLTDPERTLFRRLSAFVSGFELDAVQTVTGSGDVQRYQVLDQLTLLVDKSLVAADDSGGRTRYRLLETVRQYALEKLGESGEADEVRLRHRDYYASLAAAVDAPAGSDYEHQLDRAEIEIGNLRAAFSWSRENTDTALALTLASSLLPLWQARGHIVEGRAWFDAVLTDEVAQDAAIDGATRARALADKASIDLLFGVADSADRAQKAVALARDVDDPAVLARALTACGFTAAYNAALAGEYFAEAAGLARLSDDKWRLSAILAWQANSAIAAGDPIAARLAAEEGRDLAEAIGDTFNSRHCGVCLGLVQLWQGDVAGAVAQFRAVAAEASAAHDGFIEAISLAHQGTALAWQGNPTAARTVADAGLRSASQFGGIAISVGYFALANAALAAGDVQTALDATAAAWDQGKFAAGFAGHLCPVIALTTLASGDLVAARRWANDGVAMAKGYSLLMRALTTRARVAMAQGDSEQADRDAHDALAGTPKGIYLGSPEILECLAALAGAAGSHSEAARLFGAAAAIRQRIGLVRFKVWDAEYDASVSALRDAMGEKAFDAAWAEGAALSTDEAIAYAQRGRGQRKRPTSGWASLTPTELDVVRLVSEGLSNNDVATRLFVSPRTVQTHLTHVYAKLGLTSRVQLVQEAARHI